MLFASRTVPSFTTSILVSLNRAAVCTKSAAGRACRPTLFVIVSGRSVIASPRLLACRSLRPGAHPVKGNSRPRLGKGGEEIAAPSVERGCLLVKSKPKGGGGDGHSRDDAARPRTGRRSIGSAPLRGLRPRPGRGRDPPR